MIGGSGLIFTSQPQLRPKQFANELMNVFESYHQWQLSGRK